MIVKKYVYINCSFWFLIESYKQTQQNEYIFPRLNVFVKINFFCLVNAIKHYWRFLMYLFVLTTADLLVVV